MNAALANDPTALRVNLTVPGTSGILAGLMKLSLGVDLADILSPMMVGPKTHRVTPTGVLDVYPLGIPDGEGLLIPSRMFGGIGFSNLRGFLVIQVPPIAVDVVRAQLAADIAAGDAAGPRANDNGIGGTVTEFAVRMRPGMRKAIPLGRFGEIGVEAA